MMQISVFSLDPLARLIRRLRVVLLAAGLAGVGLTPTTAAPPERNPEPAPPLSASPELDLKARAMRVDHFGDPLPEDALARFGTVRFRQGFIVNAIGYSPDEKTIAIAGNGRALGLWDVATGKELLQFDAGTAALIPSTYAIAFSPDGKILAATRRNNVQLWNAQTGKLVRELAGHTAWPMTLAFSADGTTVISGGGHDKTIRFWDVGTGRETAKLEQHTDSVLALALSSDGKLLASGGLDKIIRVWDMETRGLLQELRGQQDVSTLSFAPSDKRLVAAGYHQLCIVWNLATGEPAFQLDEDKKAIRTAAFSPNGKWLAAGCNDGAIRLYDPATGKEVRRWDTQGFAVQRLVFSKDSKLIAANSVWECGVRFWDVATGKDTRPLDVHRSLLEEMKLSADGQSLWGLARADRRVLRWNAPTGAAAEVVPLPANATFLLGRGALSTGGAYVAWRSAADSTLHVLDLKARKDACEPLKVETRSMSVQFSPDAKVLAVGCDDGRLYLWKWQTDRQPQPRKALDGDRIEPWLFTSDGKQLVTGSPGGQSDLMHVWDVATGKTIGSFPGNKTCSALAVSPDGQWAASTFYANTVAGSIRVIDLPQRKVAREIRVGPEGGDILAFSPDGRVIAFGGDERRFSDVKLIEFATGEIIATFRGHHSGVSALEFTPDGRTLFSGGCDSTILKWDATARHGQARATAPPEAAWQALAQEASKAHPVSWDLVDAPEQAVELLRRKIQPAKKLDSKLVQRTVDLLDSDDFAERQKATQELQSLGYSAEPILRQLLETEKRPEAKQQLQRMIERLSGSEFLRIQRALQVLQTINSAGAKQLLSDLADGAPGSMLTNEATMRVDRPAQ
jgi:WD40 repeat protein